jgi:hypothetical protein
MALRGNVVPGTSTPIDLGIGISEEYLNYSAYQLWDAGTLCLGVGTNLSQQISAGTFSILPALSSMRQSSSRRPPGPSPSRCARSSRRRAHRSRHQRR